MTKFSTGYWLYRAFTRLYPIGIGLAARFGHEKAQLWLSGRNDDMWADLERARGTLPGKVVWFHAASLGEFEQARPVIEKFREEYPSWGVVLTFFSPSGYLVRKKYAGADLVSYLPLDNPENPSRFLDLVRPDLALFVKYEFWPFYLLELNRRGIPAISFSAIFRRNQVFFKPWGNFMRLVLSSFRLIYTQDEASVKLLKRIRMPHAQQAGDTRFDRVLQIAEAADKLPLIDRFKGARQTIVVGSAWPKDLEVVLKAVLLLPESLKPKVIVATHEINEDELISLEQTAGYQVVRYSKALPDSVGSADLMLIDNIGMLSSIYRYADIAWIGGAFGSGLHNILEAAVYGIPVMFGKPNYRKFKEARELLKQGGAFSCGTAEEAARAMQKLLSSPDVKTGMGHICRQYCKQHAGATDKVMDGIRRLISYN